MDLISDQIEIKLYQDYNWDSILDIFMRAKPDELKGSIKINDIVPLNKDEGLMNSFNNSVIYVAEFDNRIYGYVGYHNNLISFLFVDPLCYRKGIGTKLIEFVLPMIGEKAWLLVARANKPAIELYRKYGFNIAEEFIGKYNNKIEVNVLRLAINPILKSWE